MGRSTLAAAFALVACMMWAPRAVLSAQEGPEEVTKLRFEGNHQFSDRVLSNAIATRETECRSVFLTPFCLAGAGFSLDPSYFSPRELRRDQARVRLFYYERGYRDVAVDTIVERPSPQEVEITFRIDEGEPIIVTDVAFSGLEELSDSSIIRNLPMRDGSPLSLVALDATRDTLETRFKNRGYAHAVALRGYEISNDSPHEAQVTFGLDRGPLTRFGPITVEGEAEVEESVIRRMLPFQEGDLYRQDLRFAGLRNLYNLDIFTYVDIVPDLEHQPDSIAPLLVQVAEGDVHRVRAGGGLSTAECMNAEARWASRDYYGGARRLQITGRVSNVLAGSLENTLCTQAGTGPVFGGLNWLLSADFTQPWLFSPRNSLTLSLFGERQSVPDLYVRQALGLSLGATRTLGRSTALTLSFRPQLSKVHAFPVFFCSSYLICDPQDIGRLQELNPLSPLGLRLSRDRRNQPLNPTRGYSALMDLEYAAGWTGSKFPYTRYLADGTWYTEGDGGWVVATHLRGGMVDPGRFDGTTSEGSAKVVHPEKRFYAGGSNSVRGFPQNRLGPRVLQVKSVQDLLTLPRTDGEAFCTPESINDGSCSARGLPDSTFTPLPKGGTALLEGSVELRFPLASQLWEGATFVDFGQVWAENDHVALGDLQFTPGFGVRYFSPIGPIRVDLAYRFNGPEPLEVVAPKVQPYREGVDAPGDRLKGPDGTELDWVQSNELTILRPRVLWGDPARWSLRRLQLNLSIGQAF